MQQEKAKATISQKDESTKFPRTFWKIMEQWHGAHIPKKEEKKFSTESI